MNDKNVQTNESRGVPAFVFWSALGIVLIVADQLIKHAVFVGSAGAWLDVGYPYFYKSLFKNFKFAFSLPIPIPVMYVIYAIVIGFIIRHLIKEWRHLSRTDFLAWILILAGAVSNIMERIVQGYVRDFIYILHGIFNVADGYIIFGILVLLFKYNQKLKFDDKTGSPANSKFPMSNAK